MYETNSGIIIPSKKELEKLFMDGHDGDIYRHLNYAIKFVRGEIPNMKLGKLQDFIEMLVHELLISPKEAVYDKEGNYVAYLMDYIEDKGIKSLSCDTFLECVENLRACFDLFTNNGVYAFDAHGGNIIVNEKIYLIDFDRFWFEEDKKKLAEGNSSRYDRLIWGMIKVAFVLSFNVRYKKDDYEPWLKCCEPFHNWLDMKIDEYDALDFFAEEFKNYQRVEEYILDRRDHIVKKYSK